jgi:glycosyltransferase involved in cell wall biosynthesis/SAM-dependent methyltransferase
MPYNLKPTYISRDVPQYFDDVLSDSSSWQADVYRLAATLAREKGIQRLVDIGCGRGEKLKPLAAEFKIAGIDYEANIDAFAINIPGSDHYFSNLETAIEPPALFKDSVVICADVIEHLIDPSALLETLRNAAYTANYVLVSTPDRMRVHKKDHNGPPVNQYHAREWTLDELVGWFEQEGLPVKWAGWTISNDNRPEQRWTSLVILSQHETIDSLPITFQPAPQYRKVSKSNGSNRLKVWMTPTPSEAGRDTTNAIHQIVCRLDGLLPDYDIELIEHPDNADLRVGHAGQGSDGPIDVAHYHGLYNTAGGHDAAHFFAINSHVIRNLRAAKIVTAPSEWIADVLRRDMHLSPDIVGWGVDVNEWAPVTDPGLYVLWNKARTDAVSDPTPMLQLAAMAPQVPFLTTFGEGRQNVKTIGRQPYEVMKDYVRNASVYLATVTETFGIATVEAMASGVPVLGFRHGNTAHLVEHGVTGFLAEPGDIEGLYEGLKYCLKYRDRLGANAREAAKFYTWDRVAQSMAAIYRRALEPHQGVKVSVIIPCHNYAEYVQQAIISVQEQQTTFDYEIIVVLDRCTDTSYQAAMISHMANTNQHCNSFSIKVDNGSLSATRNDGIKAATGEYIVCLDADDRLGSALFLQTLSDALDRDRTLGIAFTSIRFMNAAGELGHLSTWPKGFDFEAQAARRNQIPSCCMFRKEAWARAGGFRPWFKYAEDAEFWTTVLGIGYGAKHVVEDGWFQYRLHSKSASQVHRTGEVKEPDWTEFHPWTKDGQRPFAAGGKPPLGSWPVRFYLNPEISVIIPVGEGHEELVKDALHSVEGQTFRMWECIVVNDTITKLDLSGFPWAKVVNQLAGEGAGAARNLGAKSANSPFLVFLDADDILKPTFLERTLETYKHHGRYAYTDWMTDDRRGKVEVHPTPEYGRESLWDHPSLHPVTALIPRYWFNAVGGFDESLTAFEDVDLYMKFFAHGFCGKRVPEPLLVYNLDTGKRRKAGEKTKKQFLALLKTRYSDFMEGKKMCDCVDPPKGKQPAPPSPDNAEEYRAAYGEMILVQYTFQYAGDSAVTLLGPGTKANYGARAKNDVFYVWEADLIAGGDMFTRVEHYDVQPQPTIVPPAPEPLIASTMQYQPAREVELKGFAGEEEIVYDQSGKIPLAMFKNDTIEGKLAEQKALPKKTTPPRGARKTKATRRKTS